MTLFKQKYLIESNRLTGWDYSTTGYYFVMICVYNRQCLFGKIVNQQMIFSERGRVIADELAKTEQIRDNVQIDEWVIMPNHLHAIIVINNQKHVETTRRVVSTTLLPNSLGSIIGQFKSKCTKRIKTLGYNDFQWQHNYNDHIIHNNQDLNRIRKYIQENPLKWEFDKENPQNDM